MYKHVTKYCWSEQIKEIGQAEHVARMEEMRIPYKILVGKPVGRSRLRWKDNTRTDIREPGCEGVD
jgi:hypothetical protein